MIYYKQEGLVCLYAMPDVFRVNNFLEKVINVKKETIKRAAAVTLAALMAGSALAGCGGNSSSSTDSKADSKTESKADATGGKVYYLNFKPEQDEAWQALAKKYTEETGTEVTVVTAAEGTYEQTLTSEMAKGDEAPTLFQVNGPVGLAKWEDFCKDLKDTDIYKQLTSTDYALEKDGKVYGIAYVIESYGIIYNKSLLNKYFESDFATVKKIDDLNSFDKLKTVAEEIQANADALGVKGAFTSPGMDSSSDWRFKTHLANLPIYFEYQADGISDTDAIKGTYLENYKNIWDLYINNTTCKPTELASKTGAESEAEFINGEAVFFQNGSWEYGAVTKDDAMKDDDLGMLPIYIGVGDEANQAATEAFINWCVTSDTGTKAMAEDMGFVIPFKAAQESQNVFVKADKEYTDAGKKPVSWNFTTMPSEDWKNGVGAALTQYAAGTGNWDAVKTAFVDNWKTEKEKAGE